jgi:hypothetical protein
MGIRIRPKTHANGLEVFNQGPRWIVGGAVKEHMFKIMSHSSLFFALPDRTGLDVEKQCHSLFRFTIHHEHIAQTVVELTESQCRVRSQIAVILRPAGGQAKRGVGRPGIGMHR